MSINSSIIFWKCFRVGLLLNLAAAPQVYSSSLVEVQRDYLSMDKRYPKLYVASEVAKVFLLLLQDNKILIATKKKLTFLVFR